jgi:phospholipid/cholesterol/gamma-HCH transport system substrate-binding protein
MSASVGRSRLGPALLGIVAVGLFVASVAVTLSFLAGGFEGGIPVRAIFARPGVGQQLPIGGDVKVRGVLVGRIADIELGDDGNAVLELRLNRDDIPVDSRADIRSKTVFGQKWVELIPGESSQMLSGGDVIPDSRTSEPLELERALQKGHDLLSTVPAEDLATIFRTLADGFTGQEQDGRRAIDKGLIALRAVNARSGELDLSLRQLAEFSEWLDDHDTDALSFMESLDSANRALVGAAPEFRTSLDSVPQFLNDFTDFQVQIEDDLGLLIEDGATLAELIAPRSDQLVDLIVQLEPFTTVWNSGLSQPCEGPFETNMKCWQVYQLPGYDHRGLYEPGQGPQANEPNDPYFGSSAGVTELTVESLRAVLEAIGGPGVPDDLARVLLAPAREQLPELMGGRR